jgi:hypothetical protein
MMLIGLESARFVFDATCLRDRGGAISDAFIDRAHSVHPTRTPNIDAKIALRPAGAEITAHSGTEDTADPAAQWMAYSQVSPDGRAIAAPAPRRRPL